jgi:hypothetical protein
VRRLLLPVTVALLALSCGQKKEEPPVIAPAPPQGAASADELTTPLGQAHGLEESLLPSTAVWTRVFVLDEQRALVAGHAATEAVALFTDDAGKTWRSFRRERDAWSSWGVGADGAIVLGFGSREGAPTPTTAALEAARLTFATFESSSTLTSPTPLFPTVKGPVTGLLQMESVGPAVLGADSAAIIAEETSRKTNIFYGGKPGADAMPPVKIPASEKVAPMPYGRPPLLLSLRGGSLVQRPFPAPGKPLEKPQKIAGIASTPTLLAELSAVPACEMGEWTFQRIKQPPRKVQILGISATKGVSSFALPDTAVPTTHVGCGAGKIVVEAVAAKKGPQATWAQQPDLPTLLTCDLTGKCVTPKNAPFRLWPEQHKRDIFTAATEQGVIAALTERAGDRWGLYLAQSADGDTYERPRIIGEGPSDRGRIELGTLFSFGKRAVLLLSADVAGTSKRGWFVMVSDDGGTSWGPP